MFQMLKYILLKHIIVIAIDSGLLLHTE